MADKSWKAWEREVAKDLGGERTGPRGYGLPDVKGIDLIAPECKYMKQVVFLEEHMQQARDNAARVGRMPAVFLKGRGGKRKSVRMDYADFVLLYHLAIKGVHADPSAFESTFASHLKGTL